MEEDLGCELTWAAVNVEHMGEFDALAKAIYREKVRRARMLTPGERMREGMDLTLQVMERMKAGVLLHYPDADEAKQVEIVRQQLAKLRKLHERGLYKALPAKE